MAVCNESFRVRVVEFLRKGHTYQEAAEIFGVSMRSICTWSKMAKQGKSLKFESVLRSPHCVNYEELLVYVKEHPKEHPDEYLREISAHFSVSITTIWTALKRLGVRKTQNLSRIRSKKTGGIYRISKKS